MGSSKSKLKDTSSLQNNNTIQPEYNLSDINLNYCDVHSYADCYSINQIPPIDLTDEVKKQIFKNATDKLDKLSIPDVESYIDNFHEDITVDILCGIIFLDNSNCDLYTRFTKKSHSILFSSADLIKLFEACIISGNDKMLQ